MARYNIDPTPGSQHPEKYKIPVKNNYKKYGELPGFIYNPYTDHYDVDKAGETKYLQDNGQLPKPPTLVDQLGPQAATIGTSVLLNQFGQRGIASLLPSAADKYAIQQTEELALKNEATKLAAQKAAEAAAQQGGGLLTVGGQSVAPVAQTVAPIATDSSGLLGIGGATEASNAAYGGNAAIDALGNSGVASTEAANAAYNSAAIGAGDAGTAAAGSGEAAGSSGIAGAALPAAGITVGALGINDLLNHNRGPVRGALQGTLSGAAAGAGIGSFFSPAGTVVGGVIGGGVGLATGLATGTVSGKSRAQHTRDDARSVFQQAGIADNDFNVKLANGNTFNIGLDGHTKYQNIGKNIDGGTSRNAWDVDFSNPLAKGAVQPIQSKVMQLLGPKATQKQIDDAVGQITNAVTSNAKSAADVNANINSVFAPKTGGVAATPVMARSAPLAQPDPSLMNDSQIQGLLKVGQDTNVPVVSNAPSQSLIQGRSIYPAQAAWQPTLPANLPPDTLQTASNGLLGIGA